MLKTFCENAMIIGNKIQLKNCFGLIDGKFAYMPCNYYYFLAGLVKTQNLKQILDIGTKFGGSILSMCQGLVDISGSKLVTVDIKEFPHSLSNTSIVAIIGDAIDKTVAKKVESNFEAPIDMIFIDANHTYEHTQKVIDIYSVLNPKFLVLDDIYLNDSMKKLWLELKEEFKERAFDATEITGRGYDCGFGVILWRD